MAVEFEGSLGRNIGLLVLRPLNPKAKAQNLWKVLSLETQNPSSLNKQGKSRNRRIEKSTECTGIPLAPYQLRLQVRISTGVFASKLRRRLLDDTLLTVGKRLWVRVLRRRVLEQIRPNDSRL